ncbi:MAG: hypothetical protein ACRC2S_20675 [Waterburya sp.]
MIHDAVNFCQEKILINNQTIIILEDWRFPKRSPDFELIESDRLSFFACSQKKINNHTT